MDLTWQSQCVCYVFYIVAGQCLVMLAAKMARKCMYFFKKEEDDNTASMIMTVFASWFCCSLSFSTHKLSPSHTHTQLPTHTHPHTHTRHRQISDGDNEATEEKDNVLELTTITTVRCDQNLLWVKKPNEKIEHVEKSYFQNIFFLHFM